jgi:type IV pilus assembly protein PilW
VRWQRGVSLIELMVALIIGLFLIFGAVTVYQQSRTTFRTTEAVARLQEAARLAMDVIEADVRMANYWGLSNEAQYIVNRAAPGETPQAPFDSLTSEVDYCGGADTNWLINLEQYLDGTNNGYGLDCDAFNGAESDSADVLVVRRGSESQPAALDQDRIYVQSSRIQGTLFIPSSACDGLSPTVATCIPAEYAPPASQTRQLVVHAYYVSNESTLRDDVPALRRKRLANINAGSVEGTIEDEEIVPGIEDLQVRFGIDTNGDASVDSYIDPDALLPTTVVISATIWLRVRSEDRDFSHTDGNTYQYADIDDFTPADNYRRIVISKTIQLRNTRI